jgi:hypothetical protein
LQGIAKYKMILENEAIPNEIFTRFFHETYYLTKNIPNYL